MLAASLHKASLLRFLDETAWVGIVVCTSHPNRLFHKVWNVAAERGLGRHESSCHVLMEPLRVGWPLHVTLAFIQADGLHTYMLAFSRLPTAGIAVLDGRAGYNLQGG